MPALRLTPRAVPGTVELIICRCRDGRHFNRHMTALGIVLLLSVLSASFTNRVSIQIDFNNGGKVNNKTDTQQSFGSGSMPHVHNGANLTLGAGEVIRYGLFRNRPYLDSQFEDKYLCNWNESTPSRSNFPDVPAGVFDFTVHIATNLKILFIGDSVGLQLFVWFERACGAIEHKRLAEIRKGEVTSDHLSIANEINGGGAITFWRMIHVWKAELQGKKDPNYGKRKRIRRRRRGGREDDTVQMLLYQSMI